MRKISTNELENKIKKARDVKEFKGILSELPEMNLSARLEQLCCAYQMTFSQVQVASGITKSLFYAMLNGTRKPQKGHILKIAVAMGVTPEEANELLKLAGQKELYAKNKEDAIILFGLKNRLNITQMEELLTDTGCRFHLIAD